MLSSHAGWQRDALEYTSVYWNLTMKLIWVGCKNAVSLDCVSGFMFHYEGTLNGMFHHCLCRHPISAGGPCSLLKLKLLGNISIYRSFLSEPFLKCQRMRASVRFPAAGGHCGCVWNHSLFAVECTKITVCHFVCLNSEWEIYICEKKKN